jgi:hypothetical protein
MGWPASGGQTHGRYTRNVRYNVYKQGGGNERGYEGDDVRKRGESAGNAKQVKARRVRAAGLTSGSL